MNWRIVSAANVTIAPRTSHCPPAARYPGWVIGAMSPLTVPPTTSATAATPSSAAPSVGRRRNAAVSSGTARYGRTASAPNPASTVPVRSAAAATDPAASPVTATSANRPSGAAIR